MLLILKHTFLIASMESIKVYEKLFNFDNENSELNTKYRFSIDDPLHMRRSSKFDEIQAKKTTSNQRLCHVEWKIQQLKVEFCVMMPFKNSQKSFIDKLWMSKLKIRKHKLLIHNSTSWHQPQIRKGLDGKIHHSNFRITTWIFPLVFRVKNANW